MAQDKTSELMEQLEKGIKDTMNSESYKAFLKVQSQFHSYSFRNAMLIYIQKPDATRVAGYKTWQKLGRQVRRGEKGIGIIAPSPYKYNKEVNQIDPKTKEPVRDPKTGNILKTQSEVKGLNFFKKSIFDISQTDGKELPSICNELLGESINSKKIIEAIKTTSSVPVIEENILSGAKGYYDRLNNVIALNEGMSLDQTAKTLIHEYAHSKLHNTEAMAMLDRATKEVQAESVAFIVSNHFGVDTSQYSFEYLASWSSGKELPELNKSFDLIQKTSTNIIQDIEDVLSQNMELEKSIVSASLDDLTSREIMWLKEYITPDEVQDHIIDSLTKSTSSIDMGENIKYVDDYMHNAMYCDNTQQKFQEQASGKYRMKELILEKYGLDPKDFDLFDCIFKRQLTEQKYSHLYKQLYKDFSAIEHVSEKTLKIIENLNTQHNKILSIKEIKDYHHNLGKRLETSFNDTDMKEFKDLEAVTNDFKQAQLTEQRYNQMIQKEMRKSLDYELAMG